MPGRATSSAQPSPTPSRRFRRSRTSPGPAPRRAEPPAPPDRRRQHLRHRQRPRRRHRHLHDLGVTLRPDATGNLVNTATVAPRAGPPIPTPGNNTATDTDTRGPRRRSLDHQDRRRHHVHTRMDRVTYTIVVTNAGPSDVSAPGRRRRARRFRQVSNISWTCVARGGVDLHRRERHRQHRPIRSTSSPAGQLTYTITANAPAGRHGQPRRTPRRSPRRAGPPTRPRATTPRPTPTPPSASPTSPSPRPTGSATYTARGSTVTYTTRRHQRRADRCHRGLGDGLGLRRSRGSRAHMDLRGRGREHPAPPDQRHRQHLRHRRRSSPAAR